MALHAIYAIERSVELMTYYYGFDIIWCKLFILIWWENYSSHICLLDVMIKKFQYSITIKCTLKKWFGLLF